MGAVADGLPAARIATCYDTPDFALRRQGLVLSIGEEGGRFVQRVTAPADGAWEDEIAENRPDPAAPHSGPRLPPGIGDRLRPVFAAEVTRTRIVIASPPAVRIAAVIEEGEIGTAEAAEPVGEIALTLERGTAAALYDLALRLLATAPLMIETRSRTERGYRLIAGTAAGAAAVSGRPLPPLAGLGCGEALRWVVRAALLRCLRNEPAALAGCAEGVRRMRVALRWLRSALAAFGKAL
ncbi:MAG TPA: hypothetical protein VJ770_00430, partial [Stellaceae bacterium]|nr:hypothetical protein [Stellaceae bacterium]